MAPLLLAALVTLSWFVPTTSAIVCDPGSRYGLPQNCSAFIMCDKHRSPKIFNCPTGLHYNAKTSSCDWPENVKCTLEENKETKVENSKRNLTAVRKDNEKITIQNTKANDNIRNVTMKNKGAVMQSVQSENKTSMVEPIVLDKSQPKEDKHNDSKKEVKVGVAKTKTTNEGAKQGVAKSEVKDKMKQINGSDTVTIIKPLEGKGELEEKYGKGKTEEKDSAQEKTTEPDFAVNKPRFNSKAFHSISKRQDKTEIKQEETKNKSESKIEKENSMGNKKLLSKTLQVEVEKSNVTKIKNFTSNEKEIDFSNKSLIDFFTKTNNTGDNINSTEVSEESVINNSSDYEFFAVPVNLSSLQGIFGYEVMSIDAINSTSDSSPASESAPTSEKAPKIENAPASENSPTSQGTSTRESAPTSQGTSTRESAPTSQGTSTLESAPTSQGTSTRESAPTSQGTSTLESAPTSQGTSTRESAPTSQGTSTLESAPTSQGTSTRESAPTSKSAPITTSEPSAGKKLAA